MSRKLQHGVLLAALLALLNSCFLSRDPQGRHTDRGRRYPHDRPQDQRP